jgi:vitellogenic carboxypeptidase-like protein
MKSVLVAAVLCGSAAATPLLLTPLLRANKTAEARSASAVTAEGIEMGNSGFFTVPTASGERLNNIFTWFQPCSNGCKPDAPFIMWFQGGPGGPGTFGALAEIGSHYVDEAIKLQKRDYSWCADNNCIFIDQPVQTGFSFQTDKAGAFDPKAIEYTATSPQAMAQALEVLTQFFAIWPEYAPAPFYIAGESYAGIYTANFAKVVAAHNAAGGAPAINLRGLAVGDPIMNWKTQMPTYPDTLHGMGVVMQKEREVLRGVMAAAVAALETNCSEAFRQWNSVWQDDAGGGAPGLFYEMTGSSMTENVLLSQEPHEFSQSNAWLAKPATAEAFHYSGIPGSSMDEGGPVYHAMVESGDFCAPSSPIYAALASTLENFDLMVFSSTSDPLLGPPTTEAGVEAVVADFGAASAKAKWEAAKKTVWKVAEADRAVAGYSKCIEGIGPSGNNRFCYVVVRNGGHELPAFQPRVAYDMFRRFVAKAPFDKAGESDAVPNTPQCSGVPPFAGPNGAGVKGCPP